MGEGGMYPRSAKPIAPNRAREIRPFMCMFILPYSHSFVNGDQEKRRLAGKTHVKMHENEVHPAHKGGKITNFQKSVETSCIFGRFGIKYIVERDGNPRPRALFIKIIYKMEDFYHVRKSCY